MRPPGQDRPLEHGCERIRSTTPFKPPAATLQEPARSPPTCGSMSLPRLPVVCAPWRTIGTTLPAARSPILPNRLLASHAFPNDGEPDTVSLAALEELPSISGEYAARCRIHAQARGPRS